MTEYVVEAPDIREQLKKTPALRRVKEIVDVERTVHREEPNITIVDNKPVAVLSIRPITRVHRIEIEYEETRTGVDEEGNEYSYKVPVKRRIESYTVNEEEGSITIEESLPESFKLYVTYGYPDKEERLRWTRYIEGKGEMSRIVREHEVLERIIKAVESNSVSKMESIYEELLGVKYSGKRTRKAVLLKLIKDYYRSEEKGKITDIVKRLHTIVAKRARWGLGCPNNCGRFIMFKPAPNLGYWIPEDPVAIETIDENGNRVPGYLQWVRDENDSKAFKYICDKCGCVVKVRMK